MSELFLSVLNMSLTASYVIILIMLIRLPLKKAPKFISYGLWGVAAFRLIIPFSFESIFSLMPRNTNAVSIPHDIIYQQSPQINSGIEAVDSFVGRLLPVSATGVSVNPLQIYTEIGAYIWILGIVALLVYSFVSIFILKKQLKGSRLIKGNIYEAKNLKTPFVLEVIKPKIYLPAGINTEERNYILLHEQTHIQRKDHIIKILAFLILSIHWFNPLVWIAFILMSRDMELSCDERVLKEMDEEVKKPYANSLLSLATGRHILNSSPLAFSEGNVKGRIKNVMNYKKPGFWVAVIAVILVVAASVGLVTNPMNTTRLPAIEGLSLKSSLNRVTYGTLISGKKHMDLNKAKAVEIADYLKEFRVNKFAVSKNRNPDRDNTNQIHFVFRAISDNDDMGNMYFNFSKNFSEVWVDNGVKPSLSYSVKKPGKVKAFFERQFGSVGKSKFDVESTVESTLDIIMSSPKTSSNPQDYINAHKNEYENLMKYGGEDALQYMLSQFEAGNAKGLRGQIMMQLCKELLGARNNVADKSLSPQEWYDALTVRQEIKLPNFKYNGEDAIEKLVYDTEIERDSASNNRGGFIIVAPKIFGSYEEENMLKVFVTTYSSRYKLYGNTLSEEGGSVIPAAITYRKDNSGKYILEEYEQAKDGSHFSPSIRKYCTMPISGKEIKGLANKILNHYGDYEDILILMEDNLFKHLRKNGMGVKDVKLNYYQGEIELFYE